MPSRQILAEAASCSIIFIFDDVLLAIDAALSVIRPCVHQLRKPELQATFRAPGPTRSRLSIRIDLGNEVSSVQCRQA